MTLKELRRLSRQELLELLIEQSDALTNLQAELEAANANLEKKSIVIGEAGTMAEATLKLNGVFEAVDNAAKQYLENIKQISDTQAENSVKIEAETRILCEKIITESKEKAQRIIDDAEKESRKKKKAADDYMRAVTRSAKELHERIQKK